MGGPRRRASRRRRTVPAGIFRAEQTRGLNHPSAAGHRRRQRRCGNDFWVCAAPR